LHKVGELVEGWLVHFLKLFLPLREEKRETNSGVVDVSGRVKVLGVEKMRRSNGVILSENGENLIAFRRPEKSGFLVKMARKISKLG